jgi:hypothetical protein
MKKGITILLIGFLLCSCSKEYVCHCQKVYEGINSTVRVNDGEFVYRDSENQARMRCESEEKSGSDAGGNFSRECKLDSDKE